MLTKLKMIKKQRRAHTYGAHLFSMCERADEKHDWVYMGLRRWEIDQGYIQISMAVREQVFDQIEESLWESFGITRGGVKNP